MCCYHKVGIMNQKLIVNKYVVYLLRGRMRDLMTKRLIQRLYILVIEITKPQFIWRTYIAIVILLEIRVARPLSSKSHERLT